MINYESSWAIPTRSLGTIKKYLEEYQVKNLLELGSGESTKMFSRMITMNKLSSIHSLEHIKTWVNEAKLKAPYASIHHCPLDKGWYDLKNLEPALPSIKFDGLLIDGPPGFFKSRDQAIKKLEHYLDSNCLVFVDDIDREQENNLFEKLCAQSQYVYSDERLGVVLINRLQ
jgi:hypothetical protein